MNRWLYRLGGRGFSGWVGRRLPLDRSVLGFVLVEAACTVGAIFLFRHGFLSFGGLIFGFWYSHWYSHFMDNLHHFWSSLDVPALGVFAGFLAILWAFALVGVFAIAALCSHLYP